MRHTGRRSIEFAVHRPKLLDYATRVVGDRAQAEDIVQEAYIRLDAMPADREIDDGFAFMRRIVRNLGIDWIRKLASEGRVVVTAVEPERVADAFPSSERALIDRQELAIVMRALDELPPRTRRALVLHRFEGRKLVEIAAELGISTTLAHKLVHEALAHCRARLTEGQ